MNTQITIEEARAWKMPFGPHKGKTIIETFALDEQYIDRLYDRLESDSLLAIVIDLVCYTKAKND